MYKVLIIRRENACFSFFLFYVNVFTNIYYFLSFFPAPVFWVSGAFFVAAITFAEAA